MEVGGSYNGVEEEVLGIVREMSLVTRTCLTRRGLRLSPDLHDGRKDRRIKNKKIVKERKKVTNKDK